MTVDIRFQDDFPANDGFDPIQHVAFAKLLRSEPLRHERKENRNDAGNDMSAMSEHGLCIDDAGFTRPRILFVSENDVDVRLVDDHRIFFLQPSDP
ncbi:MAG: hypothetical protein ACKOAX_02465, partial [Candidatus Kapaibacterium sp.]